MGCILASEPTWICGDPWSILVINSQRNHLFSLMRMPNMCSQLLPCVPPYITRHTLGSPSQNCQTPSSFSSPLHQRILGPLLNVLDMSSSNARPSATFPVKALSLIRGSTDGTTFFSINDALASAADLANRRILCMSHGTKARILSVLRQ